MTARVVVHGEKTGSRQAPDIYSKAGDTGDAYVTLLDLPLQGGVVGVGLLKNTSTKVAATGSIVAVAKASLIDGETFTLDDGTNPATVFEFDVDGGGVGVGNVAVDVSAITTAAQVKTAIINAINGVGAGLAITASSGGTATVALVNDVLGPSGNEAITETVANSGFIVSGMSGGSDQNLTCKVTVTDAFGVVGDSVEKDIAQSADLKLDPLLKSFGGSNFTTAQPPYVSYKLEVKSKLAGYPASYSMRFSAAG